MPSYAPSGLQFPDIAHPRAIRTLPLGCTAPVHVQGDVRKALADARGGPATPGRGCETLNVAWTSCTTFKIAQRSVVHVGAY